MRIFFFFIIFTASLFGRENPFFPVSPQDTPSYTTNEVEQLQPFEGFSFTLPDSARILESVTITYIKLDGSQESKTIKIHKTIDWHTPLHVNQKENSLSKKEENFKKTVSLDFISLYVSYKKIQIHTQDKLLRDFKIPQPDRIVLDFENDLDFRAYTFKEEGIFKKIRIGNHDGYYRVVFDLDGQYAYKLTKTSYGYLLILE